MKGVIYDVSGHVVVEHDLDELRYKVDISLLMCDVYLIKPEGSELLQIERIIKK